MTDTPPAAPKPVVSINLSGLTGFLNGQKTYVTLGVAAVVIFLNHIGWWPQSQFPLTLDPNNWISDEWTIVLAAAFRSAVGKVGS